MNEDIIGGHRGCHYITFNVKLCKKQATSYKKFKKQYGGKRKHELKQQIILNISILIKYIYYNKNVKNMSL